MIKQEPYICKNGVVVMHTWSDNNFYIRQIQTGVLYAEAYDIPNTYTYEETDQPIESDPERE